MAKLSAEGAKSLAFVEDDPEFAAALQHEVEAAGWRTRWFDTVAAAVSAGRDPGFPQLVLMDLELPGEDAMAGIAALSRAPRRAVVALTGHVGDDYVFEALKSGAVGYVLKSDGLGRLAAVLEEVAGGGAPMSPSVARRVVRSFRGNPDPESMLTPRETEVLEALGRGLTYSGVAELLSVSVDTVRQHVRNLYRKLHASSKAEAIAVAMRNGWID